MNENGSGIVFACVCLAIFLIIVAVYCEYLRRENRELRTVVVEQQNTNKELWTVNDELIKKLNGGE